MKKSILAALALTLALGLTACSGAAQPTAKEQPKADGVSAEKPMLVDEATKTITIYATVNGKYLVESTRHGLNYKDGKNAPKALFITPLKETDFYDTLIKLGAKAGNNLTTDSKGKTVEGQPLAVTVTWEGAGKVYTIDEVVTDSTGKPIDYRFGGNLPAAQQFMTGCMLCLDSCPVGIASNASHTFGEHDAKQVEFKGKKDLLPGDGKAVTISVRVK